MYRRSSPRIRVFALSGHLPDQLASLTYMSQEVFEDSMLKVYKSFINHVCARASQGMNKAVIQPDVQVIGDNAAFYPPITVAQSMVRLLRAEGLEAHITNNSTVFVRWPHIPTHWDDEN